MHLSAPQIKETYYDASDQVRLLLGRGCVYSYLRLLERLQCLIMILLGSGLAGLQG